MSFPVQSIGSTIYSTHIPTLGVCNPLVKSRLLFKSGPNGVIKFSERQAFDLSISVSDSYFLGVNMEDGSGTCYLVCTDKFLRDFGQVKVFAEAYLREKYTCQGYQNITEDILAEINRDLQRKLV